MAWIKEAIKLANKDSELCSINHENGHFMSAIIISRLGCSSLRNLFPRCCVNLDFYLLPDSLPEAGPGDSKPHHVLFAYISENPPCQGNCYQKLLQMLLLQDY